MQFGQTATFSATDNVQTGDTACVVLSIVEDDILEPTVEFLVSLATTPIATILSPLFAEVFVVDATSQGS